MGNMESKRASGNGDELTNPQTQDHFTPTGVCLCGGTPNLMDPKWVQHLMTHFRSSIREEVEEAVKRGLSPFVGSLQISALPSSSRSSPHQAESSAARRLQLHFVGTLPEDLLTLTDIQSEGASLKVELCDDSKSRIEDGPESSVKIMIVVLDGDFEVEDRDGWTEEDFRNNVIEQRKGKRPLLVGDYEISLRKGVADVINIKFTDNSSWMKSGKFRLGALVIKGMPHGVVVKAAVSKAFQVKERRLLALRKHQIPTPEDEVWRLVNIGKSGPTCQRLVSEKVNTVREFLQLYHADAKKLQNILHLSEKKWLETVENAESCTLSNEYYTFCDDTTRLNLLLDCVFNIRSITFEGQSSQLYEMLDDSKKELVDKVRISAYEKRSELQKVYAPTNQIPLCVPNQNMQCLDANANEKGSELQNNYVPTYQMLLQSESMCPTSITRTNIQSIDANACDKLCELQKTHGPTNQMSLQTQFVCPSSFTSINMPCHDATAGYQGMQVNFGSWSPSTQYFDHHQHGAPTDQMEGPEMDELILDSLRTLFEEKSEASTNENVTIKLKAACYVTKAALRFMISVQQDDSAPRKKQKLQ